MSLESLFHAVQETSLATAVRESELTYPIIMTMHLASIAFFGGMILMTDLRLLGLAMREIPGRAADPATALLEVGRLHRYGHLRHSAGSLEGGQLLSESVLPDQDDAAWSGGRSRAGVSAQCLP